MKNFKYLAALIFATIFASCNLMTKIDPVAYNDSIVNEQIVVIQNVSNVLSNEEMPDSAEKFRLAGVQHIEGFLKKLEELGDFKGDNTLRSAAIDLVNFYKGYMDKDFKEMIELLKKDTAATEAEYVRIEEINANFNKEQDPVYNKFVETQKEFAKKNNFKIANQE